MREKRFCLWGKRQVACILLLLFVAAIAVVVLAAVIPYAYASLTVSAARQMPIYCTDRSDKAVALTFDAAWGDEDAAAVLDILAAHNATATFFVTGDWAARCEDTVQALTAAGQELAAGGDGYLNLTSLTREQQRYQVTACSDRLRALTGVSPTLFRAPYGDFNDSLMAVLGEQGLTGIQWDVDSLDWRDASADAIAARVLTGVSSGSILRFRLDAAHTVEALPDILTALEAEGYRFLPVSALIAADSYTVNHEGRQIRR